MRARDGHNLNPSTRRQKQANLCEFRASLVYIVKEAEKERRVGGRERGN